MIPRSEIILFSDSSHSSCVPHFPAQSQTSQHQNILSIVIHLQASGKCFSYKRSFFSAVIIDNMAHTRETTTSTNGNSILCESVAPPMLPYNRKNRINDDMITALEDLIAIPINSAIKLIVIVIADLRISSR